jgi:phasin
MNESNKPHVAAEKTGAAYPKTAVQFEQIARETPEAMRVLVEKNLAQSREFYDRSKDALEGMLESWERSFGAAGQGAAALNRKVIDIAQRNINSGFDLAKSLAGARSLAEIMELQAAYWRKQFDTLGAQAEEVRSLSNQVTADAVRPVQQQVKRSTIDKI